MPLSSVLIEKNIIQIAAFNESKKFNAVEDYELWLRILNDYSALKISLPLLNYRVHSDGISSQKIKYSKKVYTVFHEIFGFPTSIFHFFGYAVFHLL